MPVMPIPKSNANQKLNAMCMTFTATATIIGITAFCIPVSQPLSPNSSTPAGTAHIRAKK